MKKSAVKKSTQSKKSVEPEVTPPADVEPEVTPPVDVEKTVTPVVKSVDEAKDTIVVTEKPVASKSENLETVFLNKLQMFVEKVAVINKEVKELQSIGKTLEKEFNNIVKVMSKQKHKSKSNENRTLSGFAMPSLLSKELYGFLNIDEGTRIPRKDVTRMINEYIKQNNLRNESDRRKILPDEKLKKIFNSSDTDEVTYFNLQTFMKHHFVKDTPVVTAQPVA